MADFSPPWGRAGGVNRSPSVDEQNDGFACGSADLTLFNRLIGRIEAELESVQTEGGIAGSEEDDTTVLQAIQAMISAATGGGDTSQFVLFSQAQARLPIFPEVTTNSGVIDVISPGTGQVRVPAGAVVLHRGIRTFTSVQVDLATTASKIYHLRWTPTGGASGTFVLKDLADVAYNPTAAAETNTAFDSAYDDMLVARVITNASNIPTITKLMNKDRPTLSGETAITDNNPYENDKTPSQIASGTVVSINWGRKPRAAIGAMTDVDGSAAGVVEFNLGMRVDSRYQARAFYQYNGPNLVGAAFSYEVWA
ncbi:hypothetical protein [Pararhizobium sp.]|uniref:hypothetical protein n=1 Tax=Pararhizobium sp. TaxID=1977563 RepID=UPI002723788D|nr:hypothetical protein [Pararhizobium sp.]MDO9417046.1 hypothetical protein [Pararhizobium sp.]